MSLSFQFDVKNGLPASDKETRSNFAVSPGKIIVELFWTKFNETGINLL